MGVRVKECLQVDCRHCRTSNPEPTTRREPRGPSGPILWCTLTVFTVAEVPEDVVALLGESDLVDGVADEAGLQQVAGVLAGLAAVLEALDVVEEPLHHVRAWREKKKKKKKASTSELGAHFYSPWPFSHLAKTCPKRFSKEMFFSLIHDTCHQWTGRGETSCSRFFNMYVWTVDLGIWILSQTRVGEQCFGV